MTLQSTNSVTRESNIELLRIVLMLMIIGFHLLVHGAGVGGSFDNYSMVDETSVMYIFLKSFLVVAVNCFVFISGFYRIKFKIRTIIHVFFQVFFYSLLFTMLADVFSPRIGLITYIEASFSLFRGVWWFITAYVALYLLSPLLNTAIDSFSKQKFLFVIISLTIINIVSGFLFSASPMGANRGFSLISFIHIYLLAQYIKKHIRLDKLEKYSIAVYVASSLLIFLLAILSISISSNSGIAKTFAYNNPIVLISAISLFFSFKQFKLKNNLINSISPYVLGVYLFHDHPLMRKYLIEHLYTLSLHPSPYIHFLSLFFFTLLIFLAGFIVDKIRAYILTPLAEFVIRRFNLVSIERMLSYKS